MSLLKTNISNFKFYIWLKRLWSKKVKNNSNMIFELVCGKKFGGDDKDNRVFMSRNYRSEMTM